MSKCSNRCNYEITKRKNFPEEIIKIFTNYSSKTREDLIPILQDIQEKYGYLSEENLALTAEYLEMPVSNVYGVATFYNQFRLIPLGKHIIRVCRGTACHVRGSGAILETLQSELGVQAGETTKDGLFTLETVACLGACSIAPVIAIDDEFYGRLAPKEISSLIKKFNN